MAEIATRSPKNSWLSTAQYTIFETHSMRFYNAERRPRASDRSLKIYPRFRDRVLFLLFFLCGLRDFAWNWLFSRKAAKSAKKKRKKSTIFFLMPNPGLTFAKFEIWNFRFEILGSKKRRASQATNKVHKISICFVLIVPTTSNEPFGYLLLCKGFSETLHSTLSRRSIDYISSIWLMFRS